MAKKPEKAKTSGPQRPSPNVIGDLIISDNRLGVGTTDNLSTLTVRARPPFNLSGTLTSTDNSATVTGTGTLFLSELSVGDVIEVGGSYDNIKGVVAVASDTSLTIDSPVLVGAASQTVQAIPSSARFDGASGSPQVCVNGNGDVGIGTTGGRAQLEVFGVGAGNYFGCPVGVRIHNTQASDAWQLVLSADAGTAEPGILMSVVADGNAQASMTVSTFDGNESDAAVDRVRIDAAGLHVLTGFCCGVSEVSANYTVAPEDHHVVANAGSGGITITLPAAGASGGRMLTIVKAAGSGNVTVNAGSGDFINAATSKIIANAYDGLHLVSTGGNVWLAQVMTAA